MSAFLSTSRISHPIAQGLTAPLSGLGFVAQRRRLWASAACFILLTLPVTLITPLLIAAFNHYGWHYGSATIEGHKAAFLLRSMLACVLVVGSVSLTHLAWTAWFAACGGRAALSLARQTENCLGIPKEEFCTGGQRDLLHELRLDLRNVSMAWAVMTIAAAAPIAGQILCAVFSPFLASTLVAHWLFFLPRCLRQEAPGRDFQLIDRNVLMTAPLGFSSLVACLVPVFGAVWMAGSVVAAVRLFRLLDDTGGMMTPRFAAAPVVTAELERFDG